MADRILVQPGMQVRIELVFDDDQEQLELVIVPDAQADFSAGFLGESTPLARTLLGHTAGETLTYRTGDARSVRILEVRPAASPALAEDVAARREEKMRQALEQAQRTDAMIFASSFSGKWGDYDPQGIENWEIKPADAPQTDKSDG